MKPLFCLFVLLAIVGYFSLQVAFGILVGVVFTMLASVYEILTCKTL